MIEVELPDGSIAEFPEGTTPDVIKGVLQKRFAAPSAQGLPMAEAGTPVGVQTRAGPGMSPEDMQANLGQLSQMTMNRAPNQNANPERTDNYIRAEMEARKIDQMRGNGAFGDATDGALNGGTMGWADDLYSNTVGAGARMVRDGVGYDEARNREQLLQEALKGNREDRSPTANMVGNLAGGLGAGSLSVGKGILGGVATGGLYGGLYGSGEAKGGWQDKLAGGAGGAAAGAVLGGAIPLIGRGIKAGAKPITDAISARVNPEKFAVQKIAQRITANGSSAETLANKMAQNAGSSVADVGGKSARTLLRTATNIPGPAKDRVTTQLNVRQFGQGDRIKDVISKTFADPDTHIAQREAILGANKKAAAPLWKTAEAQPVHFSQTLEDILETPAGKAALAKAETLAANEQEPFKQIFVNVMQNGKMVAKRVPDIRGWQQVKVALDDMINAQKDPITRQMSNEGRILVGLKNRMLSELDASNPAYAVARKASATGKQLDDAINVGKKSLTMSPEALKRELAGMNPAEREAARVGAAEALRAKIDAGGFTHNSAIKVMGGRQQAKNLEMLFESKAKFAEARKAVFAEMRKRSTYETVTGNSTTAAQMADMADAGGLQDATQFATQAVTQGPINATFSWIGSRLKMLGGLTPRVADEISKKLMTTNPAAVRQLTTELMKLEKAGIASTQKAQAIQTLITRLGLMPTAAATAPNQQRLN